MEEKKDNKKKSIVRNSSNSPDYGKLPPQAIDLEEAVIGSILLDKQSLYDVIEFLKPDHFYKEDHQKIFQSILDLGEENKPVDILTVTQQLKKMGVLEIIGGAFYIAQLTNRVASTANIEYHARIVQQKAIQRSLIATASKTIQRAYDETVDVFELIDTTQEEVGVAVESVLTTQIHSAEDVVAQVEKKFQLALEKGGVVGIPSGLKEQDKITHGYHAGEITLLAARPGQGKTAKALTEAYNIASSGIPTAFFSLEMPEAQLMQRMISNVSQVPFEKIRANELDAEQWGNMVSPYLERIKKLPLYFVDQGGISINELKNRLRRMVREHKIQMVFIDYIQLITSAGHNNRNEAIGHISRSLKALAKELDLPIVALAQLSRAVETRGGDRIPILSDLRESGDLEQDADVVMFLMRPEYYGITMDADGSSTNGLCIAAIAKHRNGSTGQINLGAKLSVMRFEDYVKDSPGMSVEDDYSSPMQSKELDY